MKNLIILFILIPFIAYSQSNELKIDKNNRKYIVQKMSREILSGLFPLPVLIILLKLNQEIFPIHL